MSDDRDRCSTKEPGDSWFPSFISASLAEEIVKAFKVLLEDPPRRFVAMSSACPLPQTVEDSRVHFGEQSRTGDVPVMNTDCLHGKILQSGYESGYEANDPPRAFIPDLGNSKG